MGPKPSKVAYIVEQLAKQVGKARQAGRPATSLSNAIVRTTAKGEIEVAVWALGELHGREKADLKRLGASVVSSFSNPSGRGIPGVGLIDAKVPFDVLDAVAALPWVAAVTPPGYAQVDPHPTNAINSEGVAFHNADDVQARGINGAGVTVGVISDGVAALATAQANNELPAVNVLDAGTNDEGTAMLEIVHDMAPGAALAFDGGAANLTDYVNAFGSLVGAGANVITEDLFWFQEPVFQVGIGAQTAENTATGGVPVHSSSGNRAQTHTARVAATGTGGTPDGATGPFAGCTNQPDNVVAIAPGGDTTFDMTLGANIMGNSTFFSLQWSEPRAIFPSAGQGGFTDLNLYVMNAALTQCLGQSVAVQGNGQGDTIEQVAMPGALAGTNVKIVVDIQGVAGAVAAPILDLRWNRGTNIDAPTAAGSINPDSNYTGLATSIAALNANSGAIEAFSSAGPVQLVQTTVCAPADPPPCAGAAGPAAVTANGVNWAAADGVRISGAGGFGVACPAGTCFFGTSASAPHSAACDALLRDELNSPGAAPAVTNARLAATAVDVAPAGVDTVTGAGRLDCLAAINDPPVADADGPYTSDEGDSVTLDGTGSSDPDTGDSIVYAWDLDNDGQFDDATGPTPSFTFGDNGVFTISLRVTDTAGATDVDSALVTVDNVLPTVAISGATLVNGIPTFIAHAGQTLNFSGHVTDPGSDDETVTWDWGDGPPSPDVSTLYLVNPPNPDPLPSPSVQPRDITDNTSHAFGAACLYTITLRSTDDDSGTASQTAVVIVAGNASRNRSAGYWFQQYRRTGVFTIAQLNCYLQIVGHMSTVFNELTNVSTIPLARGVLNPLNPTTAVKQFDRQLLAAWLNFANGSIELGSPVDTDGDGVNDSTFGAAVAAAEAVRTNPLSTTQQLIAAKNVLERINLRDGG